MLKRFSPICRHIILALTSLGMICLPGLSANAKTNPEKSMPTPKAQSDNLADDTIIVTLSPGADQDKVKEILDEVHGTVIRTLHVDKDNYDILFIKPEKGKADETIKKLADKKDKNLKAVERNFIAKP